MRVQSSSSSSIVLGLLLFKLSVINKHHRININNTAAAAAFSTTVVSTTTNFGLLRTSSCCPATITSIRSLNVFHKQSQSSHCFCSKQIEEDNTNNMSGFIIITESMTVADIVTYHPSTSDIFEKYKIDYYCCGGNIPLSNACETLSIETATVLRELNKEEASSTMMSSAAGGGDNEEKKNWGKEENIDLITNYIIKKYHDPLRMDLRGLEKLMEKVARVHGGGRHPELVLMKLVFDGLSEELKTHMMKEENILFPYMKAIYASWRDDGRNTPPPPSHHCGSVTNPIHQMEVEHQNAGKALSSLRELSQDYTVPPVDDDGSSCNSYKALFSGLEKVENDLHRHIHLENYVLHPLAIRMEQEIIQQQE